MSVLTVQAWKCDICDHVWLSDSKPKRCSKCKSSKWDKPFGVFAERVIARLPEKVRENVRPAFELAHAVNCRCYTCKPPKADGL